MKNIPKPGQLCICKGQVALYPADNGVPAMLTVYAGEILLALGPLEGNFQSFAGAMWQRVLFQERVWEIDNLAFTSGYVVPKQ